MNITTIDSALGFKHIVNRNKLGEGCGLSVSECEQYHRKEREAEHNLKQALYDYLTSKLPEKKKVVRIFDGTPEAYIQSGYNQALSDVESMLAKELGVKDE